MNDAGLVGSFERFGDLPGDVDRFGHLNRPGRESIGQRQPLDELHHQGRFAVGVVYRVERSDVGMVERGERLGLSIETRHALRRHQAIGEHFDRHFPIQPAVSGSVHLSHTALADLGGDFVNAATSPWGHAHASPVDSTSTGLYTICRSGANPMAFTHTRRTFMSVVTSLAGIAAVQTTGEAAAQTSPGAADLGWLDALRGRYKQVYDYGAYDLS